MTMSRWKEVSNEMVAREVYWNLLTLLHFCGPLLHRRMGGRRQAYYRNDEEKLYGYYLLGQMEKTQTILDLAVDPGLEPDPVSCNSLMNWYCRKA